MKLVITIILTFIYGQIIGCVCAETPTIKESFNRYPMIFHGRVVEKSIVLYSTTLLDEQLSFIREKFKNDKKRLAELEYEKIEKVTFEIVGIIKGDSITNTVTVFTSLNTSCDINFEKGKDYIVYGGRWGFNYNKYLKHARSDIEFIKDGLYWAEYCSRTRAFDSQEKNELIQLKRG